MDKTKMISIKNLKGMASNYESSNLRDDLVKDAQNVFFDKNLGVVRSDGYVRDNAVSIGSQPIDNLGRFVTPTGAEYLMVVSSNLLLFTANAGTYTVIVSTLNPKFQYDCTDALGAYWCTSTTGAFYIDGDLNIHDVVSNFPLGDKITKHQNRLWVANSSFPIIYASGFLNGSLWSLGGNASDPVAFTIGINDGDTITGFYSAFDKLYIGKRRSFWKLIGRSQLDFQQVNISPLIGCSQHKSMRDKHGNLYWLSQRGLEKLDGYQDLIYPIFGNPIQDILENITSGFDSTALKDMIDTTQGDFSLGLSTYVSLINPTDSLTVSKPSTGTYALDYIFFAGNLIPQVFLIGSGADPTVSVSTVAQSFRISNPLNGSLIQAQVRLWVKQNVGSHEFLTATLRQSDVTYATRPASVALATATIAAAVPDRINSTIELGSIIEGPIFDPFQKGCDGQSYANYNAKIIFNSTPSLTAGVTYWLVFHSTSSAGGCPSFAVQPSSTEAHYVDGFSYTWGGSAGIEVLSTQSIAMQLYFSSAIFASSIKDLGEAAPKNGYFGADYVQDGGPVLFFIRTAASASSLLSASWLPQNPNSTTTVLNRFFQWKVDMAISSPTHNPVINSVDLTYGGVTGKAHVASWVKDDRYYLSCSTSNFSGATNETVLIVDKFDNFSKLNDVPASSFAEAFQNFYFGSSVSTGATTGLIFKFTPDTFNYDGRVMDSFVETKDYCGDICDSVKEWNKVYVKTQNSKTGGGTLSTSFQFDRDGTYASLGDVSLIEKNGLIDSKVLFPFGSSGNIGKSVRFKFRNRQLNQPFNFFEATPYYRERKPD